LEFDFDGAKRKINRYKKEREKDDEVFGRKKMGDIQEFTE